MRVGVEPLGRAVDLQFVEHGERPAARFGLADAADSQGLSHLVADRHQRVEKGHRVLEDHGDGAAAIAHHLPLRKRQQILAVELDPTGQPSHPVESHQRAGRHRFPGPGLADEGDALPDVHRVKSTPSTMRRVVAP